MFGGGVTLRPEPRGGPDGRRGCPLFSGRSSWGKVTEQTPVVVNGLRPGSGQSPGTADVCGLFDRGAPARFVGLRRAACALWRGGDPEDVRLNQMVPAACPAHFDDVHGEFFVRSRESDQFFGRSSRSGDRSEPVAEHPGYESQLFFSANGTHDTAGPAVELGGTKQVRTRVTHLGYTRSSGVYLGQQGPTLKRVVHDLPLYSHENQSTSVAFRWGPLGLLPCRFPGRVRKN